MLVLKTFAVSEGKVEHTVGTDYYHRGRRGGSTSGGKRQEGREEEGREAGKRKGNCSHDSRTNASLGVGEGRSGEPRIMALRQARRKESTPRTFVWVVVNAYGVFTLQSLAMVTT